MQKSINAATFKKMLQSAYSTLEGKKELVDSLNVFPVPDGDTGTNMCLTMRTAIMEVNNSEGHSIEDICIACNRGALKGARGNSGVILSQIFKGICAELMDCRNEITAKDLVKAFKNGSEIAYKAVTVPKEGTILTIIRAIADSSKQIFKEEKDLEVFLHKIIEHAEEVLQRTPDMLPVLKKAGVVDAGGRGLVIILEGMYKALTGQDVNVEFNDAAVVDVSSEELHIQYEDIGKIEFAYCTEFFIINLKEKTTESDIDTLRSKLLEFGDCVICLGDLSLVKVHIHTNEPNKALALALQLGELNGIKIENMLEQNREFKKQSQKQLKEYGLVAVAAGDGLANIFKDLSVDYVITGGQTMNPSANDIATAIDKVKAKNVFVLPNNKNIILAAQQANEITNSNIIVIETKSIPEGVAAALGFDENKSIEENISSMTKAFKNVKSGSVTYAVRTTETNGFELEKGDIIGLDQKTIISKAKDVNKCCEEVVGKLVDDDKSNITVFYGAEVTAEKADKLLASLEEKYPDFDVVMADGGQPIYYYIISVE